MYRYQKAFGVDFDLGFDLAIFPFLRDKSQATDCCPSFIFSSKHQGQWRYQVLWVNACDETQSLTCSRYKIVEAKYTKHFRAEFVEKDNSPVLFESNSSDDLCRYLIAYK